MKLGRPTRHDKADILQHALDLSKKVGYRDITRDMLAKEAGTSPALISKYFGTMMKLRRAIMSAAVAQNDHAIIAQGLAAGDSKARAADMSVKRIAVEGLLV